MNKTLPYVGIGFLIVTTILTSIDVKKINKKLSLLEQKVQHELKVENVMGDKELEKFYEINEKRVYLEIDGKPVEEYFKK